MYSKIDKTLRFQRASSTVGGAAIGQSPGSPDSRTETVYRDSV